MPAINFSLKPSKKKERKTIKSGNRTQVIEKNVTGVVCINIDAVYYVKIGDSQYPIHKDCYSCKGKQYIYRQGEYDKSRVVYIRTVDNCYESIPNFWLPFNVGCVVTGDIVFNHDAYVKQFVIKQCWIEWHNDEATEAINFYKEHLNVINDIIRKRRINET